MSTIDQARIEFGVAATNIAGNIDALLPQLASRGAEVAKAGNAIAEKTRLLRSAGKEFQEATGDVQTADFGRIGDEIKALLPQLADHGADIAAIGSAIRSYCNQLTVVDAQHKHITDPENAEVVGQPHVNNGFGAGPFNTGITTNITPADTSKVIVNPNPAGEESEELNPTPKPVDAAA